MRRQSRGDLRGIKEKKHRGNLPCHTEPAILLFIIFLFQGSMKGIIRQVFLSIIIGGLFLSYPISAKDPSEKPIVYFGFIPLYTPQLMYERFQPLLDYLSSNTPYRFKMRLSNDYEGIITLLQEGRIDIALLGGATYGLAIRERMELVPILKLLNKEGKPFYRSIIITRKDKGINSLSELKGKSFAFASRWSTSGDIAPLYYLYSNGIGLKDLSRYTHMRYHESVVREVLKGSYDAGAAIETSVHSYEGEELKFLFISDPISALSIFVRKDAPHALTNSVKKALLNLNPDNPRHWEILKEWGEDIRYGFTEASESDFDDILKMIAYLKKQGVYSKR